ncbi:hypothetical protein HZ326_27894 [Fusarium oxysporum f. sp. albedinis]|nr:hypothetical protein HZ326_27894 [Fusarium oxysporum f. sp. albedinis]
MQYLHRWNRASLSKQLLDRPLTLEAFCYVIRYGFRCESCMTGCRWGLRFMAENGQEREWSDIQPTICLSIQMHKSQEDIR